jgi:peptidoglycan hydrolase-like protein with peptidoglycan-binding domain
VPLITRFFLPLLAALALLLVPAGGAAAVTPAPAAAGPGTGTAPAAARSVPRIRASVLRPGARGSAVRALQQVLNRVGFRVAVNGRYLAETSGAVQRFQIARRLDASGIAGPATIRALRSAARGPRSTAAEGGLGFGEATERIRQLGDRIPLVAGMSGADVRQLQAFLRRAGVRGAPRPTGEFGAQTAAAVRRYERSERRPVDGGLDAGDIYALLADLGQDGSGENPAATPAPAPLAPGDRARVRAGGIAVAPEGAPQAVKQIIAAGNQIAKMPYRWGGGHGRWVDSGYDCSGSVSFALRGAGLMKGGALPSYGFYDWGESGPGRWVTIYTNQGHMYMVVAGIRFDTSGRGANRSRWQTAMRDPSSFKVRHPAGL